jgi:hypothetical protein
MFSRLSQIDRNIERNIERNKVLPIPHIERCATQGRRSPGVVQRDPLNLPVHFHSLRRKGEQRKRPVLVEEDNSITHANQIAFRKCPILPEDARRLGLDAGDRRPRVAA